MSSAASFLSSVMGCSAGVLSGGVQGTALALPAGYSTSFVLHAGSGITETFLRWGDVLLAAYGKPRAAPNSSVSLEYLGYSTTGSYFYAHRKNETYQETMLAVKAEADRVGLPYRWFLIDSWWYYEGKVPGPRDEGVCFDGFSGVSWQWDSSPIPPAANCTANFPGGWSGFAKELGLPLMMHISEWSGRKVSGKTASPNPYGPPPYSVKDPAGWIVEDGCSIPQTSAFWDTIFRDMSTNGGLAVYKQDHGGGEIAQLHAAQQNVSVMDNWLTRQGDAAARHGVTKMLCGSISSFWMHSVSIKAATHTRAGNDYLTGITRTADVCDHPDANIFAGRVSNAKIGFSNMINWAVGLRPYKDTWLSGHQDWSTSTCMVSGSAGSVSVLPPYFGAQEKHPKLQALVSALSAGPIAPGDVVGSGDPVLIMTVCRTDGMLLKPDRPAYPPDALFLQRLRGAGEVQATHTTVGGFRWVFLLSFGMSKPAALAGDDVGIVATDSGVLWSVENQDPFSRVTAANLTRFAAHAPASFPLQPPDRDWGLYTYSRTAPTTCNGTGWTLLGELQKIISMSAQRITHLEAECAGADAGGPELHLGVTGAGNETVELTFLPPSHATVRADVKLQVVTVVLPASGVATITCRRGSCQADAQ